MREDSAMRLKCVLAVLLLVAFGGCGGSESPVARLEVEPTEHNLEYPGFVKLRLRWKIEAPLEELEGEPLVMVHLLEEPGVVLRTFDHPVRFDWQPGRSLEYEIRLFQSSLAPPLSPGTYILSVGLYDKGGKRWPLEVTGKAVDRFEYQMGEVLVAEESDETPMFSFSQTWMPIEGGVDRQVLARRWLVGEGSIRVSEIPEAGTVWMVINLPSPQEGSEELILENGAKEPVVQVSNSCGESEVSIAGQGLHEIEFAMAPGPEGQLPEECEITIRPNFQVLALDTLARRSVSLEVLAWSPS